MAEPPRGDAGPRRFDALVTDWGGVLTTRISDSFEAFVADHAVDPEVLNRVLHDAYREGGTDDHPVRAIETGQMTEEDFFVALAALLSEGLDAPIDPSGMKERLFALVKPEERMLAAVRAVRAAGVRTALVSNSWGRSGFPVEELAELFDEVVISGEVGLRKPDPAIYRLAAERLGVPVERCVFVDDIRSNIDGAEAVGMRGLHHLEMDTTLRAFEELFGVSLEAVRP